MNLQKHMNALLGKKPIAKTISSDELTDLLIDLNDHAGEDQGSNDAFTDLNITINADALNAVTPKSSQALSAINSSEIIHQALMQEDDLTTVVIAPDGTVISPTQTICSFVAGETVSDNITTLSELTTFYARHLDMRGDETEALKSVLMQRVDAHIDHPTGRNFVWTSTMKDGRVLRIRTKYAPTGHLVIFVSDVTEIDNELKLLRLGMRMGTSGYWTFDYNTGKLACSQYIRDILTDAELERTRHSGLLSLVHPDDFDNAAVAFLQAQSSKTQLNGTYLIVTEKFGNMWFNIVGEFQTFSTDGNKSCFVAYINDVTKDVRHRKEIEDVNALSNAKTQFFARMSHEIKTPLNAIVGMTDALMEEIHNDDARETARYISDAANSLDSVLSQTLEHARLSSNKLMLDIMTSDVRDIVRSTCAIFKKQCLDKGLALSVRIADTVPNTVETDPTRLRQCLTNLLSNAVKFTQTGRIDVALALLDNDTPAPRLVLAVKDTGIGMNPKQADNIFMPFAQADETIRRRFGGAGLGMAITRQIVETMKGDIRVKSQPNAGTTIVISMPLKITQEELFQPTSEYMLTLNELNETPLKFNAVKATEPVREPEPEETASKIDSQSLQISKKVSTQTENYSGFDILVVEDNLVNQRVVAKLLTGHVRSIHFAFNGEEALSILERQRFDIIFMDIHMPVKDGIETTLEIRNSGRPYADIVIIALTADPDYQQKRICRNIGMNDTVGKPVRRQDLLDVMERVFTERAAQTENAA